jgi:hypothetical protein
MHGIKDIIEEAAALPVEDRVFIVDSLLRTLNTPDPDMDKVWAGIARRRLEELRSGRVMTVSGEEVFAEVRERFSR